jgi:hypothetical protein
MAFESVSRFSDFQAEYEGSIPFTRSSLFKDLTRGSAGVRTHQNRISWFGEEVLNARVEIGGDGTQACVDLRR